MKNKAFTLIEITIVVTIIALLGTIFIANYRGGERQFALKRSAHKLSQDMRAVQEMAMSSQTTPLEFGPETFPKGGYGIHFKKDRSFYIVFADCNGNGEADETGAALTCEDATELNPFPETIETIFLEENINVFDLSPISGGNTLEITFFPPDPIVTINPSANSASIILSFDGQTKTVSINSVGLIDID